MPFKIDCASLIVRRRFTIFALFYFVFGGNFQVQAPGGGGDLYLEGQFNGGGGLCYEFGGLMHGGAYFRNCMVFHPLMKFYFIFSHIFALFEYKYFTPKI